YTGHHGFDPTTSSEMRAIMLAAGPKLKAGFTSRPIVMTDHYNLICHMLDLEPRPNNGSWSRIKPMLKHAVDSALLNAPHTQSQSSRNNATCLVGNASFVSFFLLSIIS